MRPRQGDGKFRTRDSGKPAAQKKGIAPAVALPGGLRQPLQKNNVGGSQAGACPTPFLQEEVSQFPGNNVQDQVLFDSQNAVFAFVVPSVVTFTYLPFLYTLANTKAIAPLFGGNDSQPAPGRREQLSQAATPSVRWERFATGPTSGKSRGSQLVFFWQEYSRLVTFTELGVGWIGNNKYLGIKPRCVPRHNLGAIH